MSDIEINWTDAAAVISRLRAGTDRFLVALIPTPWDPIRGMLPSGEVVTTREGFGGYNVGMILLRSDGRTRVLLHRIAEAVLDSGVLNERGIPIRLGMTPPDDLRAKMAAADGREAEEKGQA